MEAGRHAVPGHGGPWCPIKDSGCHLVGQEETLQVKCQRNRPWQVGKKSFRSEAGAKMGSEGRRNQSREDDKDLQQQAAALLLGQRGQAVATGYARERRRRMPEWGFTG